MATGLLGRKVGMTHIFTADGDCIPVTVLQMGPCTVIRRKTAEKDGYDAVVLGFVEVDEKKEKRLSKAEVGVFKKAGTAGLPPPEGGPRPATPSSSASSRPATSSRSTRSSSSTSGWTSPASPRVAASPASSSAGE